MSLLRCPKSLSSHHIITTTATATRTTSPLSSPSSIARTFTRTLTSSTTTTRSTFASSSGINRVVKRYDPINSSNSYNNTNNTRPFHTSPARMSDHEGVHNLLSMADYQSALKQPGSMVIDCYATWCGPCKMIAPKVVEFSKTFEQTRFYKLDVDEVPDVAQELSITAMPTFVLFKDGELADTVMGASAPALQAAIQKVQA